MYRMFKLTMWRSAALSGLIAILVCGLSANAGQIVQGNVTINITGTAGELMMTDEVIIPILPGGTFDMKDVPTLGEGMWQGTLGAWGNVDPFTNLAFNVTNIALVPVGFTVSVLLPIAPIPGATLHGGSTGGSTTDANNSGTGGLSTLAGIPYYAGQIDGATVLPIYPDPTSFTFFFAGQTVTIPALNPGLPGPTLPSGPALASIGIVHRFLLSPGDTAAGTSFFIVEPIPEPSSIVLAVIGGMGLLLWARRRRRK